MRKVKMRITQKKTADKEVTDYLDAVINENQLAAVLPSGMDGVVMLLMQGGVKHLVKGKLSDWVK